MSVDLKPFVNALRKKDTKKVREWLEQNKGNFNPADEFGRGYLLALQGMTSVLEGSGEMSLIKRLVNGDYDGKHITTLLLEAKARLSLKFRPNDEQGFDTAWVDVLKEFSEEKI